MRARLGWVGLTAVCCVSSVAASAAPPEATLAVVPGSIEALAQDGPRLAWISSTELCRGRATLFDLRTRRQISLGSGCANLEGAVAVGGSRIVWEQQLGEGNTELDSRGLTATEADPRGRSVATIDVIDSQETWPPPLVAGDGATLVLWTARDAYQGWRGVEGIVGGKAHRLFKANHPLALAVAGSEVAELEYADPCLCNFAPQWSPDGKRIAWSRGDSVYVMNADGSGMRRVSQTPVDDKRYPEALTYLPRWSPDCTRLAYTYQAIAGAAPELHVVNVDGSGDRRLAAGGAPRWSPTGQRLSFIRGGDVWTIAADGSAARRLTDDGTDIAAASWSPDGTRLAEARSAGLYVLRADGGGQTRIASTQRPSPGLAPEWSPSGGQIAFIHGQRLTVVNPEGTGLRDLAEGVDPSWSPDGTRIAFDQMDISGSSRVFVVTLANGAATEVKLPYHGGNPAWSPDGRLLAVGDAGIPSDRSRHTAGIYTVAPDGSTPTKLAPPDTTQLEIRDAQTGARIHSYSLPGGAYALAFSRTFFAVLDARTSLEPDVLRVYRTQTGASVAALPVAKNPANDPCDFRCTRLAVSDSGIVVFRLRAQLRAFDATTGTVRTIATARGMPVGLSLDGNRLVWSDSRPRQSILHSLLLPARLAS